MKIEAHERRVRLSPNFSANIYYLITFQSGEITTVWGFSNLEMAARANHPNPPLKGSPGNYAAAARMNERLTYRKIHMENVQNATDGRVISLPRELMQEAGLKIGDDVEIRGASHAFYIKKRDNPQ